ncbi:ATP-binding protein [Streptomyces zingiberis]|uniref:ATP-binding protein n=1 Tax=Streptomyces zingiberis TaxID=2053010 RepID=UPI0019D2C165|nr:ATP-binding protein [Streptomyces zingiberis]
MISSSRGHRAVEFRTLPSRIGPIRRIVSAHLRYWHLDPLIDAATRGLTELLGQVDRQARPGRPCTVELRLRQDRLTVAVHDGDPRPPGPGAPAVPGAPAAPGGAAADRDPVPAPFAGRESWGMRRREGDGATVVWFSLRVPVAAGPDGAASPAPCTAPPPREPARGPVRTPGGQPRGVASPDTGPAPRPGAGRGRAPQREHARFRSGRTGAARPAPD